MLFRLQSATTMHTSRHLCRLVILFGAVCLHAQTEPPPADAPAPESSNPYLRAIERAEGVEAQNDARADEIMAIVATEEAPATDAPATAVTEAPAVPETPAPAVDGISTNRPPPPDLPDTLPLPIVPQGDVILELPGSSAEPTVAREADLITIDFPDEDVRTIIRNVAELYDLNVVIPDSLVGRVSLKLRDVSWRQVFDVLLEPLNYTYIEDRNIIKIKSVEELAAEPVVTRVFIVNFAAAPDLLPAIQPLINATLGGRIQVERRSNALVVTERPSKMNEVQEIIEILDRPTEQVMIESKFVEVTNRDQTDIGVDWSSLSGYEVGAGPFLREYEDENVRELERGTEGVEEIVTSQGTGGNTTDYENTTTTSNLSNYLDTLTRRDTAVLTADEFNLVLRALESENEIQLVSNPTVVTLNNTAARINIGEQYPVPRFTYNEEIGRFQVTGFDYKDIGIILNVLPQINSAGFINLNIKPEISSRTGEVPFEQSAIPIITTRTTESTVTIKSGYTLAIGGLIERNTGDIQTKVPLLGDIPGLGRLFRSDTTTEDRRNLIIFITAKVLSAQGATYRDVFSQRRIYEMGIKDRDLPGYEPPETEEALFTELQDAREELERMRSEARLREQLQTLNKTTDKERQDIEKESDKPSSDEVRRRFQ